MLRMPIITLHAANAIDFIVRDLTIVTRMHVSFMEKMKIF